MNICSYVHCLVSTPITVKTKELPDRNQLLRNDSDNKSMAENTNLGCTRNESLSRYHLHQVSFWYVLLYTCRNLRGRSPLVRALGMASGSSTLVRKASFPSLVQPIHVPPPSTSLPPRIFFEPSPHHPTAFVGLHQFIKKKIQSDEHWTASIVVL